VAWMETRYARTGEETWLKMTKYWSRLLLVNFAVGVVTGITLEFQFGMNWAEYSKFVGDIFGAPLAIEATVAFFLESTFIGVWLFSWKRLSRGAHAALMWIVAFASTLSALWILLANGWMQHPVGYELVSERAQLMSFAALIFNPYAWVKFFHTVSSAYTLSAFFIMGVSAINILRGRKEEMFRKSFRISAAFGLLMSVLVIVAGDFSAVEVAKSQPPKLAAMEAQWESVKGADFALLALPRANGEGRVLEALKIPGGTSFLAYRDARAEVKGLKDFPPAERPPVLSTFLCFRIMVVLGFLFVVLALVGVILGWRKTVEKHRWFLWIMAVAIVLPYLASELGWFLAELGRQPWIVYGLLKTSAAVSTSISAGDVLGSLVAFIVIYGALVAVDVLLLAKYARRIED